MLTLLYMKRWSKKRTCAAAHVLFSWSFQRQDDEFWMIEQTKRKQAVPETTTDDQFSLLFLIAACRHGWKESLTRRIQTFRKR